MLSPHSHTQDSMLALQHESLPHFLENHLAEGARKNRLVISKFREVLFICPICVYGPILLAGGVNMRLRCIKKKIVRHERILGNLTTHVRKTHLPTFTMNAGNHRKKIVHVARSIFCVICVFNVFWVAGTLISLFSVK